MLKNILYVSLVTISLSIASTLSSNAEKTEANLEKSPLNWTLSEFLGQDVENKQGKTIGDVNNLVFNKEGAIDVVVVGVGGFLGMGEKNIAVPYSNIAIVREKSGSLKVSTPLSQEELKTMPAFETSNKLISPKLAEKVRNTAEEVTDTIKENSMKAKKVIENKAAEVKQHVKEAYEQ